MKKLFKKIDNDISINEDCADYNSIFLNQNIVPNTNNKKENECNNYECYIESRCKDYMEQNEWEILMEQMNLIGILVI